jgi:hypothetical protein
MQMQDLPIYPSPPIDQRIGETVNRYERLGLEGRQ